MEMNTIDIMMLGVRMKEARLNSRNHLTQLEVAVELGVHVSTISKYEEGIRRPPVNVIYAYMQLFGVDANQLIGTVEGQQKISIEQRLSTLTPAARRYLMEVFNILIDKCPRIY